jgi:hypothetical protein
MNIVDYNRLVSTELLLTQLRTSSSIRKAAYRLLLANIHYYPLLRTQV